MAENFRRVGRHVLYVLEVEGSSLKNGRSPAQGRTTSYAVRAGGGRVHTTLGVFQTRDQAVRFVQGYSPRMGLLTPS